MKRRSLIGLLAAAAVISGGLALTTDSDTLLPALLTFPFAQIGSGLRALSLSGTVGNGLAWVLLCLLSAVPLGIWAVLKRRNRACRADLLLALLTPVLAVVLYNMVNPYGALFGGTTVGLDVYKAQFGAVVYVILLGWLVLRILHRFAHADEAALFRWLGLFVTALAVLFVISAAGGCLGEFLSGVRSVRAGNVGTGSLTVTYLFLGLRALVGGVPLLMDTAAAVLALDLLEAMAADSPDQAAAAHRLSRWCALTLVVTTLCGIGFHVLQMLFMDSIRSLSSTVVLPVTSIAFLLICMAAARIIADNKTLRDENDLFV